MAHDHAPMLTNLADVTPAWLTTILRQAGVLSSGSVTALTLRSNPAFNSQVVHLAITYSPDAPSTAPQALLLKGNRDHHGAYEHAFYALQHDLPPAALPVPRCYATAYDSASGQSVCLLADLSATHRPPVSRERLLALDGVPNAHQLTQIITALAQFHAFWWEHPELGTGASIFAVRPWYRDAAFYGQHIARRQREWAQFRAAVGSTLPHAWQTHLTTALDGLPLLWERQLAPRILGRDQLTLSHGDCYLTQFLVPLAADDPQAVLVDFDSVSANFAAYDLAYLMPTFWTRAQRQDQQREEHLLRQYHTALKDAGVQGYSWETLITDYRLMITLMLFDPIWDQTSGAAERYWRPKLACLVAAYEDWHCAELLA
jgi:thiamine kinase-like enzyme